MARLKAAGAIVLCKTNIPQLMVLHETDNPVYGRTNNPWDRQLTHVRAEYLQRFQRAMQARSIDVLLCPPHALPALPHGATEHLAPAGRYSMLFNVLGLPAGVAPITQVRADEKSERKPTADLADRAAITTDARSAGLPVGVQVAAAPWREDYVLAVMQTLEEAFAASRPAL